jgi:hypothetical protein
VICLSVSEFYEGSNLCSQIEKFKFIVLRQINSTFINLIKPVQV